MRTDPALLRVGRFFGVPLYFSASWLLIAVITTALYGSLVRRLVTDISTQAAYLAAFGFAVALALCVLAHELGHTAVSLALGRPVKRVVIFFLGGVSEIEGEIDRARDELLIALAGPVVSGLLAGLAAGAFAFARHGSVAWALLALLTWSNVVVAVFNLLPGLPLDGGRVLRAATWGLSRSAQTGTAVASWGGRVVGLLIAIGGVWATLDRLGTVRLDLRLPDGGLHLERRHGRDANFVGHQPAGHVASGRSDATRCPGAGRRLARRGRPAHP